MCTQLVPRMGRPPPFRTPAEWQRCLCSLPAFGEVAGSGLRKEAAGAPGRLVREVRTQSGSPGLLPPRTASPGGCSPSPLHMDRLCPWGGLWLTAVEPGLRVRQRAEQSRDNRVLPPAERSRAPPPPRRAASGDRSLEPVCSGLPQEGPREGEQGALSFGGVENPRAPGVPPRAWDPGTQQGMGGPS